MDILVVDDNGYNGNELISCIKEAVPYSSVILSDYDCADITAESSRFDVVFLSAESCEFIRTADKLRYISPKINIIVCASDNRFMPDAIRMHASGYITGYASVDEVRNQFDNLLYPCRIRIVAFGNFGIFADGKPVKFRRSKSMEVLAFLVDRRSACTRKQIAATIFEDRSYDRSCQKYLDNILRDLSLDLKDAGIPELMVHSNNLYSLNRDIFTCDYYEYIEYHRNQYRFNGEYMSQYSWSEITLSILNRI